MKAITITSLLAALTITFAVVADEKKDTQKGPKAEKGMPKGKGKGGMPPRPKFSDLDLDSDGKISREEFGKTRFAKMMTERGDADMLEKLFKMKDQNSDGSIDLKEHLTELSGKGKGKGKGMKGGKGKGMEGGEEEPKKPKRPVIK